MDFNARIRELQAAILVKKARHKGHALLDWRLERTRTKQLKAELREERKRAKAQKDLVSLARQ